MPVSLPKVRTMLTLAATAVIIPLVAPAQPASAEPDPCAGRVDGGTGGDAYIGRAVDGRHKQQIWGNWYNCSGGTGVDRVRMDIENDTDGPCISVAYGTNGVYNTIRLFNWLQPHYRGWYRC